MTTQTDQTGPPQTDSATDSAQTEEFALAKRKLILHDALTFLSLSLVTALLFVITLVLFRSFAAHRSDLAIRWASRGDAALAAGKPDQAIVALRAALAYDPGQRSYQLSLARALGDAGRTDESFNYFSGLWDAEPGSGFINLELARLEARKGDKQGAVHYYRASIYGTWEGDGVVRRRDVRLELARYLLAQRDFANARMELLIAGGNAPPDAPLDVALADMLRQAGDNADALAYYQKALSAKPNDAAALEDAGRLAFALGDFGRARRLLERALRERAATPADTPQRRAAILSQLDDAERILSMAPSQKLPDGARVSRILALRAIAKKRLAACSFQLAPTGPPPAPLQALNAQWLAPDAALDRAGLMHDTDRQDAIAQLAYSTEIAASQLCGHPTGDDALLLDLAKVPQQGAP